MKVYVAVYNGTDTNNILGVFTDITKARKAILIDFENTKLNYEPNIKEIIGDRIYMEETGLWFDEWYVAETELHN